MGPPGAGKSMLARRLTTILPAMTLAEAIETTRIPSRRRPPQRPHGIRDCLSTCCVNPRMIAFQTAGEPYQCHQVFHLARQSRKGRSITCVALPSPTDTNPSVTPAGIRCSRFPTLVRLVGIKVADRLNMRARHAMSYVS